MVQGGGVGVPDHTVGLYQAGVNQTTFSYTIFPF